MHHEIAICFILSLWPSPAITPASCLHGRNDTHDTSMQVMWLDRDNKGSKKSKWCGPSPPKTGGNKQPKWVKWLNPLGETQESSDFRGFISWWWNTKTVWSFTIKYQQRHDKQDTDIRNEPFSSWIHTATWQRRRSACDVVSILIQVLPAFPALVFLAAWSIRVDLQVISTPENRYTSVFSDFHGFSSECATMADMSVIVPHKELNPWKSENMLRECRENCLSPYSLAGHLCRCLSFEGCKPWWTNANFMRTSCTSKVSSCVIHSNFDDIFFLFHSSFLYSWRHTAAPCELYWTGFISDTWACSAHGLRKSTFSLQA